MISALGLCADIFDYPDNDCVEKIRYLGELTKREKLKNFFLLQDEIENEYIRLFSIGATSYKTVPLASWWIDGKMMGRSFIKIKDFYRDCGFIVSVDDIKLPQDHISLMFSFVVILLEEDKIFEVEEFINNYLQWLIEFENSLKTSSTIELYGEIIAVARDLISTLKILVKNL